MQTFLIISVVLAVAAVSHAAPQTATHSPEVVEGVKSIRELVRNTLVDITTAAIADDSVKGQKIKDTLDSYAKKASELLQKARAVESPTKEQTKETVTKFLEILGEAKEAVKDDVKTLKPETRVFIVEKFTTALTKAKAITQQLAASQ